MFSGTALADTISVDDDSGMDFQKIQDAVNAANDNDTILVYNGTYTENVDVNKSVSIISESGNPDDTIVQAASTGDHTFDVDRNDVKINGFNVTGAGGLGSAGIYLNDVQNINISDSHLSYNDYGININNSSNNIVSNNTASYNYFGFKLEKSNNNILKDNIANSNNADGIFLASSSNNNTLCNNTVMDNAQGLSIFNSNNNTLNKNNVSLNNGNDGSGINLFNATNNKLNNNTANSNNASGILIADSKYNILNNNTANFNNRSGIALLTNTVALPLGCSSNNLTENNASGNEYDGIYLSDSSNNNLNNNTAYNNKNHGIHIAATSLGPGYGVPRNNTMNNNTVNANEGSGFYLYYTNGNILNNNTAKMNLYNGIHLFNSRNNDIDGNLAYSNNYHGIYFNRNCSSNILNNNNLSNNDNGIKFETFCKNNILKNNNASNNIEGIHISSSSNNTLSKNIALKNLNNGIYILSSSNSTIEYNIASKNNDGIYLRKSGNNTLKNNTICYNDRIGINLRHDTNNNTIYNNYINNMNNTDIEPDTYNTWNITKTSGPNIVSGPNIGGNYWAHPNRTGFSQICNDTDNDGFCDKKYEINSNNIDYLPLTINASIDIEKHTNGKDSDEPSGSAIQIGRQVKWTYNVTNTGNVTLKNITVNDNKLGEITCPSNTLEPGESMTCTKTGSVQSGQYSNIGNVTAVYEDNICGEIHVGDSDPSHYFGYDHRIDVPTANPVLMVGVLGIVMLLFLRREKK